MTMTTTKTTTTTKIISIGEMIDSVIVILRDNAKEYSKQIVDKEEKHVFDEMVTSFLFEFLIRKEQLRKK